MTRAQIIRKKTGIILAILGIVLSLLPAVRMADGTKLFIFQLIGNEKFFDQTVIAESPETLLTGIILCVILIFGFLVHILNLIIWLQKTEKTYLGIMGFSWASFLMLIMGSAICCMGAHDGGVAAFPLTIWQTLRVLITLSEAVIKLNGEELINVFFPEK